MYRYLTMTPVLPFRATLRVVVLLGAAFVASAGSASAQAFLAPYIGYNFGNDALCPASMPSCNEKNPVVGVAFGNLNALIGFEEDLSYSKGLLKSPGVGQANVLTLMSNLVLSPMLFSYVRPYGVGGFGLMRVTSEFNPTSLLQLNQSDIGWNIGGGVMVTYGHVGVRGDLRFFHGFNDIDISGLPGGDRKLDYGRATVAFVLQ